MPQSCIESVLRNIPQTRAPLDGGRPWHLLIELAGDDEDRLDDALGSALAAALDTKLIDDAIVAQNERESEEFWRIRDSISEAERADGPALQHDISVPVDLMPTFIADNPRRLVAEFPGARAMSFGHLGDGNVHHHVKPPRDADAGRWLADNGEAASRLVYRHVLELGGSISAEHGIGQMKRDLLAELDSPARMAALRGIKVGLDPQGLFNPGKLIA